MNNWLRSIYTVRFNDCDPLGHLNNGRYIDYFLNAREDHLREHYNLDLAQLARQGQAWVVRDHQVAFMRPSHYNEQISICSGLLELSPDHLLVEMAMFDAGENQLKSLLHTRFVPVNPLTGKRDQHQPSFMDFLSDKLMEIDSKGKMDHSARLGFWQQHVKSKTNQ